MAEVAPQTAWTAAQTRAQFWAVAWLRLRIFRNGLRRKGGMGDLVATLIMVPLFLGFIFGPSIGAGVVSWWLVSTGKMHLLTLVLWAIFGLCQLTNIQLGQANVAFDPTQLIRFPLSFRGYALVRTFFGLIAPANVAGTLMSFAVAVGVSIAQPELALYAFAAMAAFALMNIFFTRMLFSWIDRWLSTRRAREIFTGLIFAVSLGIQYVNFTFNPGFQHGAHARQVTAARVVAAKGFYHHAQPVLNALPPGMTMRAMAAAQSGNISVYSLRVAGVLAFAAFFFAVFAWRLYREFRGENLSNAANAVAKAAPIARATPMQAFSSVASPETGGAMHFSAPPVIAAVFGKELLTMRRNMGVFYAVLAPMFFVILFVSRLSGRFPSQYVFPAAVAYTTLSITALCYNVLGLEAAGIQFYFLAPVKMRDVFMAKNMVTAGMMALEMLTVLVTVIVAGKAPPVYTVVGTVLWMAMATLISLTLGNWRSITAPKKVDPAKMSRQQQASPLSTLLSVGVLLLCFGLAAAVVGLGAWLHLPWLLPATMLVFASAAWFVYQAGLNSLDNLLAKNRDMLSETLCKQ